MTLGVRNRLPLLPINVAIIAIVLFTYTGEVKSAGQQYVGKFLGKLSELHHGVSGEVYAVDGRTLHIKDFTYDGQGPAAYFYAGNSKEPSNLGGFRVPDERGSTGVLKRYRKHSITLALPDGKTLNNIKWFSVWCDEFSVNFGDIRVPRNFEYPKPQKIDPLNGVHNIASDNIVIVDAQTLLVPNLSYDGEAPDAKFWVGRGPKPSPQGIRVPDENGKEIPLRRYDRKTVVLTLPQDLTVFDIGHFGIWCEAFTVDFGHVQIPSNLNVPPSLKMLGISPQSKLNCEVLNDDLAFEVRWAVAGDSIIVQLVSKLDDGEYMSFGVSGDENKSVMVGGDVVVAWVDKTSLKGYAIDYYLDAKSQCSGKRGSCPDENIASNTNSVRLLNAAMVNGYSIVTYQRTLKPADHLDKQILTNKPQAIIWAIGPLNQRNEVSFHNHYLKTDYLLDFGRQPKWNCPMPETDRPVAISNPIPIDSPTSTPSRSGGRFEDFADTDSKAVITSRRGSTTRGSTRNNERRQRTTTAAPRTVPTPKAVANRDAWDIPAIQCYEPEDGVFYAQMGPTGGKKGYSAITGHVGWGISWYINGLLIPEINVVRGKTYTFVVEGGLNPDIPARYHPFYITDDPIGGYEYKTPEERSKVQIFAGVSTTRTGDLLPTGTGRLCHWTPKGDTYPEDFASFGGYQRTLELVCDEGEPGVITWTPDKNTPDTVYYQCWSHRYLGWKINVLDSCDIASAGSDLVPAIENAPISLKTSHTGDFSDDFEASPSILLEHRIKPNDISFSTQNKDIYNMNPVYTHDQNIHNKNPSVVMNTDNLFRQSAVLNFKPSQLDVARELLEPPVTTTEAYDNINTSSSWSNIKVLDLPEPPEIITLEQFTTLPSPTPSSEDTSPESFVVTSTTSATSTIGSVEKNTFLLNQSEHVTEQKNTPDRETQAPLSLLRYASKPNFPQGLIHNQISFRRPSNNMNFNIRPPFMHKPPHVFNTRYGITNRPVPVRPPFINHNMFIKKPYYRPTMSKRPIPMATILRPVTQFPPKHFSGKPVFMKPPPAITFRTNNVPVYKKPQVQLPMLNINLPPPKFVNNPHVNDKSNSTYMAIETFKNIPMLQMLQNNKFAVLNNEQKNSFPNANDTASFLNKFVFPVTLSKQSTLLIPDKSTLNTQIQDFNSKPLNTKSSMFIFQTQISTTTELTPNEQKQNDDTTVTEDPVLSPSKMISIQPDFRKTHSTMRPAINTGFHPESVIIEGGFKPIISKPVPVAQDRISEVDDMESVSDTIGVIDFTKTDRAHENKKVFPLLPTETFEPMFIPSPPDRQSIRNKTSSNSETARNTLNTHIYLRQISATSKSNNPLTSNKEDKSFAREDQRDENQEEDEMMMAAERIDTYYLPPMSKSRSRITQHPANIKIPSGTIVTYDGKIVSDVNLSPPVVSRSNFAKSGLSKTEQLVRATPQFGSFKGELPPPIPSNIRPETIPQLRNFKQNFKLANGQQSDLNNSPPESTKLSLVQLKRNVNLEERDAVAAELSRTHHKLEKSRQKRTPHHTPEHTAQQKNMTETHSKSASAKWNTSSIFPLMFSIFVLIVSNL